MDQVLTDARSSLRAIQDNAHFLDASCQEVMPLLELFAAIVAAERAGVITSAQVEHASSNLDATDLSALRRDLPVAVAQIKQRVRRVEHLLRVLEPFDQAAANG